MPRRSKNNDYVYVIFAVLMVLFIVISIYFQIQGAIQCSEDGGQYLRNWANWPVCVGGK